METSSNLFIIWSASALFTLFALHSPFCTCSALKNTTDNHFWVVILGPQSFWCFSFSFLWSAPFIDEWIWRISLNLRTWTPAIHAENNLLLGFFCKKLQRLFEGGLKKTLSFWLPWQSFESIISETFEQTKENTDIFCKRKYGAIMQIDSICIRTLASPNYSHFWSTKQERFKKKKEAYSPRDGRSQRNRGGQRLLMIWELEGLLFSSGRRCPVHPHDRWPAGTHKKQEEQWKLSFLRNLLENWITQKWEIQPLKSLESLSWNWLFPGRQCEIGLLILLTLKGVNNSFHLNPFKVI